MTHESGTKTIYRLFSVDKETTAERDKFSPFQRNFVQTGSYRSLLIAKSVMCVVYMYVLYASL